MPRPLFTTLQCFLLGKTQISVPDLSALLANSSWPLTLKLMCPQRSCPVYPIQAPPLVLIAPSSFPALHTAIDPIPSMTLGHRKVLDKYLLNKWMVNKLLNALGLCNRTAKSKTRFYFRFSLNTLYNRGHIWVLLFQEQIHTRGGIIQTDYTTLAHTCHPPWTLHGQRHARKTERPHFPAATTIHKGVHLSVTPDCAAEGRNNIEYQHLASWLTMGTTPALLGLP